MRYRPITLLLLGVIAAALFAAGVRGYWSVQDLQARTRLESALKANHLQGRQGLARTMTITPQGWLVSHAKVAYLGPGNWRIQYIDPYLARIDTPAKITKVGQEPTLTQIRKVHLPGVVRVNMPAQSGREQASDLDNYRVRHLGSDQMATRPAEIIALADRETGQLVRIFWIDKESGILLRQDRLEENGRLLSSTEFLAVSLLPQKDDAIDESQRNVPEQSLRAAQEVALPELSKQLGFSVVLPRQLPYGFGLRGSYLFTCPCGCGGASAHLRFSDGIRSFSVFEMKEDMPNCDFAAKIAAGARGEVLDLNQTLKAAISKDEDIVIVVIGDLPEATLKHIAASF